MKCVLFSCPMPEAVAYNGARGHWDFQILFSLSPSSSSSSSQSLVQAGQGLCYPATPPDPQDKTLADEELFLRTSKNSGFFLKDYFSQSTFKYLMSNFPENKT